MKLIFGTKDPKNKILWDEEDVEIGVGGYLLNTAELPSGTLYVEKGTMIHTDYSTGLANVVKSAKVVSGGTTTIPRVEKNHQFVVGDICYKVAGGVAVTISSIDSSNATYDVITFDGALTTLTAGDIVMQSSAAGATAGAMKYAPNGFTNDSIVVSDNTSVSNVISVSEILESNLPYYVSADHKTALTFNFTFI